MRVTITGVHSLRNRGVEAFLRPTIEQVKARFPNVPINVLTRDLEYGKARLANSPVQLFDELCFQNVFDNRYYSAIHKLFGLPNLERFSGCKEVLSLLAKSSFVIALGGDVFSSEYGFWYMKSCLRPLEMALKQNIPIAFIAHSVGPFKTEAEAKKWTQIASRASLITVRENMSYKYVTETLSMPKELVSLTADPAFILKPPHVMHTRKLLASYGFDGTKPIVGISPSQGICCYSKSDSKRHFDSWHRIIDTILNEFNAFVLIVPHVHDTIPDNDDRMLAKMLVKSFDSDPRIRLAEGDLSASEFKGLLGACDLAIAERMHASIAALSSGVCTVPVGYSVKAEGIMKDLFDERLVDDTLLIPISDFVDSNVACDRIRAAWIKRNEIAKKLKETLPAMKKRALDNFRLIESVFGSSDKSLKC